MVQSIFQLAFGYRHAPSAQQIALQEYIDAVHESLKRIDRLTEQIGKWCPSGDWRRLWKPAGRPGRLADRGGNHARGNRRSEPFSTSEPLMAYLGLVPSEHSSGDRIKRGGITKTGNGHARKVLIEAAWAYRLQPRVSRALRKRQENLSEPIRQIAWKAQLRCVPGTKG